MGTTIAKVDSKLPVITGTLSGTAASNGWYISPVAFNGSASDATSGLASFTCTLDGAALGSCASIAINSEGAHTLILTARDNAGNIRTLTQNASIDTLAPLLNAGLSGTLGSNNWYTNAALNAAASDPTPGSGLSSLEYNLDNSGWLPFPVSGVLPLMEGQHMIDLRAADRAGHAVSSSKTFWLDSTVPNLSVNAVGTFGANNWYITNPDISASASDTTSGMDALDYSLDNSAWTTYVSPISLSEGVHTVSFWAQDQAGLVKQVDATYQVDTRPPQMAGSLSGVAGADGWYISDVTLTASASDPTPGSGMDTFTYSLNNADPIPYTAPISLSDGQHTIQLTANDQAGLSDSTVQTIKIDTIQPSLDIFASLPNWVKESVNISGSANDMGSGLARVELSIDDGQTWLPVQDLSSWSYAWNTLNIADGIYDVRVRATDVAGLVTEKNFSAGVDNHAPEINLPASWYQWDTVAVDVFDNYSGLAEASIEISDPEGRWQKRAIALDVNQFPLQFKWDRRFGDGTTAPAGTYDTKLIARDALGNSTEKTAAITVVLSILPPGPTATSQPIIRATATPIPTNSPAPRISPTVTPTAVVSIFGKIEPTAQWTSTPVASPTPRVAPTQTGIMDWLDSILAPNANSGEKIISIDASDSSTGTEPMDGQSNVLWGAAAAAMVGAVTAYAAEERRKQEEAKARQAALEAQEEERHKKIQAQKLEKMEAQRAQEAAWEQARKEQEAREAAYGEHLAAKTTREEVQESKEWTASLIDNRENWQEKKKAAEEKKKSDELAAKLDAFYHNALKQDEKAAPPPEPNWWEKTKSFVGDLPFVQPVLDARKEVIEFRQDLVHGVVTWVDEKIVQPVLATEAMQRTIEFTQKEVADVKSAVEKVTTPVTAKISEGIGKAVTWANETIYQPVLKPALEKTAKFVSSEVKWIDEKIYQPYVKPVVSWVDEKVYQPYVKPVVDKEIQFIKDEFDWVNEKVYAPIFKPVVDDIATHVIKPKVEKISNWWDKHGEWVHGALDAVGLIPGAGEIADGLNAILYLTEGRYLEATLSAVSAIPLLGSFGTGAKTVVQAGEELVDTVFGKVVKEFAGEALEKAAKESLEEVAEKTAKETIEFLSDAWIQKAIEMVGLIPGMGTASTTITAAIQLGQKNFLDATMSLVSMVPVVGGVATTAKGILESSWERLVKEAAQEMSEKLSKEAVEAGAEAIIKEVTEEVAEKITKEVVEEGAEAITKEVSEEVVEILVKEGSEVTEKIAVEMVEEGTEKVAKVVGEELAETTAKDLTDEALEKVAEKVNREIKEDIYEDIKEKISKAETDSDVKNTTDDVVVAKTVEESTQSTDRTKVLESLRNMYGDDLINSAEKLGIDPTTILNNPPEPGQSFEGWLLGISEPKSPVNLPSDLKLRPEEIEQLLSKSLHNTESNEFVLGYFDPNKVNGYLEVGKDRKATYLMMEQSLYNEIGFKDKTGDFWQINRGAIQYGLNERKTFVLSTDLETIGNNPGKYTYAEIKMILHPGNNYAVINRDGYDMLVPKETLKP